MTEPRTTPIDELRTAYQRIPAGTPSAEDVLAELPRLYAAIENVLINENPCKELGEAYVECQRLLIEAMTDQQRQRWEEPRSNDVGATWRKVAEAGRRAETSDPATGKDHRMSVLRRLIEWVEGDEGEGCLYCAGPMGDGEVVQHESDCIVLAARQSVDGHSGCRCLCHDS